MSTSTASSTGVAFFSLLALASCGPSIDDLIDGLASEGERLDQAKQELLIAKEGAVPALLAAFEDSDRAVSRVELAEVLAGLLMRIDDDRLAAALRSHLRSDPDPEVRARIAAELGMLKRADFIDEFLRATDDDSGIVRAAAFRALNLTKSKHSEAQTAALIAAAQERQSDENRDASLEARIIVAEKVNTWLQEAQGALLKGAFAEAESLYVAALDYAPTDKKANFTYGRFLYDNEREQEGLEVWRRSGWLLDIPLVEQAPEIDGRLDDPIWEQAVRTGPFFTWSTRHNAAQLSEHATDVAVLRTEEALYFGALCEDAHPESLVVSTTTRDGPDEHLQDLVEFFFDIDRDQKVACKVTVNSIGVISDGCITLPNFRDYDYTWSPESEAAAHVGDDFWSVEYKLLFDQTGLQYVPEIPRPTAGELWAIDIQRGYRAAVTWSQWTRSYPHMTSLDSYGFFLF